MNIISTDPDMFRRKSTSQNFFRDVSQMHLKFRGYIPTFKVYNIPLNLPFKTQRNEI